MKTDAPSVVSLVLGVALEVPAIAALFLWLQEPMLFPSTPIEEGVFGLALLRVVLFLAVPKIRRMKVAPAVIVLSADVLLIPLAIGVALLTGDADFSAFGAQYFASWLSSALLLYTPLAAVLVVDSMRRRARLAALAPAAAGSFVLSALLLQGVGSAGVGEGLSSVARSALEGPVRGYVPGQEVSAVIVGCSSLLFASVLAYGVTLGSDRTGRVVPALAVGATGVAVLLGWVQLASLQPFAVLYLAPAAVVGVIWGFTRES